MSPTPNPTVVSRPLAIPTYSKNLQALATPAPWCVDGLDQPLTNEECAAAGLSPDDLAAQLANMGPEPGWVECTATDAAGETLYDWWAAECPEVPTP